MNPADAWLDVVSGGLPRTRSPMLAAAAVGGPAQMSDAPGTAGLPEPGGVAWHDLSLFYAWDLHCGRDPQGGPGDLGAAPVAGPLLGSTEVERHLGWKARSTEVRRYRSDCAHTAGGHVLHLPPIRPAGLCLLRMHRHASSGQRQSWPWRVMLAARCSARCPVPSTWRPDGYCMRCGRGPPPKRRHGEALLPPKAVALGCGELC